MLILSSVTNTQPDYVALAMVLVLAVIVAVLAIRKKFAKAKTPDAAEASAPAEVVEEVAAPGAAGQVKLHDVEPKKAAMLMAIVADKMGKPLNELRFISIKEVK